MTFIGPITFFRTYFSNTCYASLSGLFWKTDRGRADKISTGCFSIHLFQFKQNLSTTWINLQTFSKMSPKLRSKVFKTQGLSGSPFEKHWSIHLRNTRDVWEVYGNTNLYICVCLVSVGKLTYDYGAKAMEYNYLYILWRISICGEVFHKLLECESTFN